LLFLFFFVCFGKLGIGNENNKYGYYAKHFS